MGFSYFPLSAIQAAARKPAWEGLSYRRSFGRAAVNDCPKPDADEIVSALPPESEIPLAERKEIRLDWDDEIRRQVRRLQIHALSRYQDDAFPAIAVPRPVHGQSQALAELFGCRLVPQETEPGLFYPVPWIESPTDLDRIRIKPVDECLYGKAIEFARYASDATNGELAVRNPVMTGPIDCANYILGTMRLMQWIMDEPKALHRLLRMITEALAEVIQKLKAATAGNLCPDLCVCLPRGFTVCSEVRSLISLEAYQEYESPYLKMLGEACGLYVVHSCGTWERTLPLDMTDGNLMMIHFQTREMDLGKVIGSTNGTMSLYVGRSIDLDERYTFLDAADYYRHLMTAFCKPAPICFSITDIEKYLSVQKELNGGPSQMFRWMPA